ncbi:MAG TPA: hypothetical protein VFX01_00320 [Methylophilaceae bacterium]|nr:hypothetical protein [Methylophilaceae bacterium]
MWRKLRIAILLFILATVAHRTWLQTHAPEWRNNFYVALYPINVDGSPHVAQYLSTLDPEAFQAISAYMAEQAQRFGLRLRRPFEVQLGPEISSLPPQSAKSANVLQAMLWSLQFRWWAWRHSPEMPVKPDIRLYLLYFDAAKYHLLPHSASLNKGRIGLVNVFADPADAKQNNVVIAHELLHTVGASDKYDLSNNQPLYPAGYAEPDKAPLYPQDIAELMAGRVPLSETTAEIPASLAQTLIGEQTACEIGWIK